MSSEKKTLKNDNPIYDLTKHPRCGAKKRISGNCSQPAMHNGKCRLHGGLSSGAKTLSGKQRCREARLKHGYYSAETIAQRKHIKSTLKQVKQLIEAIISS
jgi:hypothetical protein